MVRTGKSLPWIEPASGVGEMGMIAVVWIIAVFGTMVTVTVGSRSVVRKELSESRQRKTHRIRRKIGKAFFSIVSWWFLSFRAV